MKSLFLLISIFAGMAQAYVSAPGGPGTMLTWARPDKDSYATTLKRPLWLTSVKGGITEIAFPSVDRVQTRDSYLVIRGRHGLWDERFISNFETKRVKSTLVHTATATDHGIELKKTFLVHPSQDSVVIDYQLKFPDDSAKEIIFIHNPTAEQTSGGDEMLVDTQSTHPSLFVYQADIRGDESRFNSPHAYQAVTWSLKNSEGVTGFFGVNSPLESLQRQEKLNGFTKASYGNVVGALATTSNAREIKFRVVISFTTDANWKKTLNGLNSLALSGDLNQLIGEQRDEWLNYLSGLNYEKSDELAEASILLLKAAEDKKNPGALIAAPANPSIPWHIEAPEHNYEDARRRRGDSNAGYRRVWPRDLYHKGMAFLSVGDYATAIDILRWYCKVQLKDFRVGSWAQNMDTLGNPSWNAFQIDQTAFPIVLVRRLVDLQQVSYSEFREMTRAAADFILAVGPNTDQERWEENGGLSPNSLAATVEGLFAAAHLEDKFGDKNLGQKYRERGEFWASQLKNWALIRNGHFGQNYFARMEIGRDGQWRPDLNDEIFIQNKREGTANRFREDEILDGGFLQWIIAGLVDPLDQDFSRTLVLYDSYIRKNTPWGRGYLRYNQDAYGENHWGGIWPILSAERALVAIERNEPYQEHLDLIRNIATPTGLIGEQDTLAVRPLLWSHGAYLILMRSERDHRSFYRSDTRH